MSLSTAIIVPELVVFVAGSTLGLQTRTLLTQRFSTARLRPHLALGHTICVEGSTSVVDCVVNRGISAAATEILVTLSHREWSLRPHKFVEE